MSCGCRAPIAEGAGRAGAAAALALTLALSSGPAPARPTGDFASEPVTAPDATGGPGIARICALIARSARAHGLPPDFFARLIWKESRFDVRALSPVGAQGIAQFMPGTAAERGLEDPWDPEQAIPASASFLADLRGQFGNWGLAAAAYNGGPDRVARWLERGGALPLETLDYVHSITFRPASWFRERGREVEPRPLDAARGFEAGCRSLPVMPTRAALGGGGRKPWGVQVAFGRSHGAAQHAWSRLRARHAGLLAGQEAVVMRNRKGRLSAPYVVRLGANSRREAGRLCARLKGAGLPCVVQRN